MICNKDCFNCIYEDCIIDGSFNREYHKQYYLKNKDKILEYQKQYCLKNKDKISEYQKQYRLKNKEKILEYNGNIIGAIK